MSGKRVSCPASTARAKLDGDLVRDMRDQPSAVLKARARMRGLGVEWAAPAIG
jgi:hypothetical protein